jgi:hypothetical protein
VRNFGDIDGHPQSPREGRDEPGNLEGEALFGQAKKAQSLGGFGGEVAARFSSGASGLCEVIEVPGDHDSMVLEPNVRVMAAKLKAVIARVEGDKRNVVPLATAAE